MTELPAQARALTFTSNGVCAALAVAGGSDLRISNERSGTPLGPELKGVGDAPQVQLAPDCKRVATIGEDEQLRIWDTRTGRFVLPRREDGDPFGFFQSAIFSPDGEWVATQANDGTARVWSAETGAPRTQPLGRLGFIRDVAFTADGRYVTGSGHGLTAMVWEAATGERLAEFRDPPFSIAGDGIVAWCADGRRAITVANAYLQDSYRQDVVVQVHSLDPDTRDVEMLSTLAQLVAGRRIDESGSFVSLTRSELRSLAETMRASLTDRHSAGQAP
jgi:WD40 repeat protein